MVKKGDIIMEFKSAICTSIEQSKRLLELGLKKETADMWHIAQIKDWRGNDIPKRNQKWWLSFDGIGVGVGFDQFEHIPAWSLHRLVEIMFKGDIEGFVGYNIHANSVNIMYEYAISNIEALIKMGTFNKDYLEEQKK